jgi:cytochrome c
MRSIPFGVLTLSAALLSASQLGARIKKAAPDPNAKPVPPVVADMRKDDCFVCHGTGKKVVGPAFKDVALRYKGVPNAQEALLAKVTKGGAGNWGQIPMAPHRHLSYGSLDQMVAWVLKQS